MGAQGTLGAAAPVQRPGRLHAARECAAIQSAKTGAHASPCCENYSIPERWQGRPCPAIHHRRPTTRAALLNHQARTFWCAALRSAVYPYVSRIHPHPDSAAGTHNIVQILGRVSTCFLLKFAADPAFAEACGARLRWRRCEPKRRGGWQTALQTASRNRTAVRRRILSFLLIRPATMRTCPPLPSVELVAPRWAA